MATSYHDSGITESFYMGLWALCSNMMVGVFVQEIITPNLILWIWVVLSEFNYIENNTFKKWRLFLRRQKQENDEKLKLFALCKKGNNFQRISKIFKELSIGCHVSIPRVLFIAWEKHHVSLRRLFWVSVRFQKKNNHFLSVYFVMTPPSDLVWKQYVSQDFQIIPFRRGQ